MTSLGSVRKVKNYDLALENAANFFLYGPPSRSITYIYFTQWASTKNNSIWVKVDIVMNFLKTWKSYFLAVDPRRWSQDRHAQSCDVDSGRLMKYWVKVARSDFWVTMPFNFERLEQHHYQSNRKSRLLSGKFPKRVKISPASTTVITFIVIVLAPDNLACLGKVAGKQSRVLWIHDIQKCTIAW